MKSTSNWISENAYNQIDGNQLDVGLDSLLQVEQETYTEIIKLYFIVLIAGQPKRHLLTTGWSVFVSAKRLVAGDSVLFIW